VWNTRIKIRVLTYQCQRLGEFGPAKAPEKQGLDEILEKAGETFGQTTERNDFYKADPLGKRTGNACDPKLLGILKKTCDDAEASESKKQAEMRVPLTAKLLKEKVDNIRGAVTILYPKGLPPYDPVRLLLENKEGAIVGQDSKLLLDAHTATLWFAGKEFFRDSLVSDRVRHERSKITAKLQRKGAKAPAREPAVSEAERKAMMAHYFKRNEEAKKLAENDDDDFLNSAWANPKGLKSRLHGSSGGVRFRAGGQRF